MNTKAFWAWVWMGLMWAPLLLAGGGNGGSTSDTLDPVITGTANTNAFNAAGTWPLTAANADSTGTVSFVTGQVGGGVLMFNGSGSITTNKLSGFATVSPTGVMTGDLTGPATGLLRVEKLNTNSAVNGDVMTFNGTVWTNKAATSSLPSLPSYQYGALVGDTNTGTAVYRNYAPWKRLPNWERVVNDAIWVTQTDVNLMPIVSTNWPAPGVSTIASAKTFYATNNVAPQWFVMLGNIPTNFGSGASAAFVKGTFPFQNSGGSFIVATRSTEVTNEFQFKTGSGGPCALETYVNGKSLGTYGRFGLPQSTNINLKLVFPDRRGHDIAIVASGYSTALGFGYAFGNPGSVYFPQHLRDDGAHWITGDSGLMGFGNGGEEGMTNSFGGFPAKLIMATGQNWIFDGVPGTAFLSGSSKYVNRLTNDVPWCIAQGYKIKDIWAGGGSTDNGSNSVQIVAGITNFWQLAATICPGAERRQIQAWNYTPTGSTPNYTTSVVAACSLSGVPLINVNDRIDSSMFGSSTYIWQSGSFAAHPTTLGHQLQTDVTLQQMVLQSNGVMNVDQ